MKKRALSLILAVVLAYALLPTAALAAEGYTVTEVVPCKYDWLNGGESFTGGPYFCEGLTIAILDGKLGFIDSTGKEVVPCKYDHAENFSEGLAVVELNNKWGFIDKTGKEVIPLKYDYVGSFSEGLAAVNVGCDESASGGKWGFLDKTGKEVELRTAEYDRVAGFDQGLAIVELNDKVGFIDKTGKEVVPCKYDKVQRFSEGLAAVALVTDEKNEYGYTLEQWGFIDTTGKEVVPCKYTYVTNFSEGLAMVALDGKCGFIDKTGKDVIPCTYDEVNFFGFSEGLAAVKRDGKWGFIDKTGKEVVPCKYDDVHSFSEGLASVALATDEKDKYGNTIDQWGFIDTTGKEVISLKYENVNSFSEGLASVALDGKWGFIDKTGKEVIPLKYDDVNNFYNNFHEGLAPVCIGDPYNGGKWGLVDTTGKEVVPCKYGDVVSCSGGLVAVETEDGWGFLAIDGYAGTSTIPATPTAYPSTQEVDVDGEKITFQCYALKDENGYDTNYIKLRDLADILNSSAAQFEVDWNDGQVTITTQTAYTPNGSEQKTPFRGQRTYQEVTAQTLVDGKAVDLSAFTLTDDNGGGYTYYKLRDLGNALGIKVDWSAERGIFIETK